ncbi:MAG: penicillin acylase family protein [Verrucomicrobia bacterium]|nr:penicillin acylase family protein [Verrucomicrobiota bacterium]
MSRLFNPRMNSRSRLFSFYLVVVLTTTLSSGAAPKTKYGKIELIQDTWGIPHVFADTDAGAMYGLGYATAEDRGFQMTYNLRIIQGRLAEIVGARQRGNRKETAVDSDRKMRTFGWERAAERTAANLDRGTRQLLEAYCAGVNDSFAAQKVAGRLHPLFKKLEVEPEAWTPADCLLSWWHLAQFFATDGTRDLMVLRNREHPRPGQPQPFKPGAMWFDDATAVVQRSDVSDEWVKRVEDFRSARGLGAGSHSGDAPKFSHAWVVGGKKTTTGAAVLVSDPQTPVRNPSLWMEFHISGKTINARGIGVPGSPGLLIGFTRNVAWGLTALGADQADLFRLETDPKRPDEYRWNGKWRKMEVRTEQIKVKGAQAVEIKLRETHLGLVASEFCFRQPGDPEVALKRIPMCETDRDTIQGVFAMMRARNATEFVKAFDDWRFPSANCVYGDRAGHIGYSVLGAVPMRSKQATDSNGNEATAGTVDLDDWQGFVPQELLPHIVDPRAGLLLSANHRPVGSFYKIPLGISTGSMGDTIRSWRLRERLDMKQKFTPADVLDVHYDTVNAARREIVRLGLHLRDTKQGELSDEANEALAVLEKWFKSGASSDLKSDGAELATRISTFFRFIATPVALKYGGGESGLARFLKDAARRIAADPKAAFDEDECRFISTIIEDAWIEAGLGTDAARERTGGKPGSAQTLGWFDTLDGFGSLDPAGDLTQPDITCLDGQTIHSQAAQSYTQFVPLHDVDSAQTICPIGHSDRPDVRFRTSTMNLWGAAKLHAAPLSREGVERIAAERSVLSK